MKYLLITLAIREGERVHTHRCLHTTNAENINFAAERYASTYWGYGEREDDYWWFFGEIIVRVEFVTAMSKYEYRLMSRIFSGDNPNNHFEIVHAGYRTEAEREEVQIKIGEVADLFLIRTDEGIIVDLYNEEDNIASMGLLDDELETGLPQIDEVAEFKKEWGQSDEEISTCLGYDNDEGLADLLMPDYFWLEETSQWYPKCSSMYSEREQKIANNLK